MSREREQNLQQANEALRTLNDISQEREVKGNANVAAGRYGDMVANMVKYAESQMALNALEDDSEDDSPTTTASLYQGSEAQSLPSRQHVEPEAKRGQNVINPT